MTKVFSSETHLNLFHVFICLDGQARTPAV